jgi:hypothetical protein
LASSSWATHTKHLALLFSFGGQILLQKNSWLPIFHWLLFNFPNQNLFDSIAVASSCLLIERAALSGFQ